MHEEVLGLQWGQKGFLLPAPCYHGLGLMLGGSGITRVRFRWL